MDNKLDRIKKTLIILGTIFNIVSGCFLLGIIGSIIFTAPKFLIDIFTVSIIVFFDLGLICYLSVLIVKIFFAKENKVNAENLAFDKLIADYYNGALPEDVWRVVEYYEKTKTQGHLRFFAGLEIYKQNETVETLIKILPLEFSNNLYDAYEVFKDLNLNENTKSVYLEDSEDSPFKEYDLFFKSNTQKYENYIKYYVGIINDANN